MEEAEQKNYYGKRPMWQWVVLYVVIGGILYAGVYYFYFAKKGGYTSSENNSQNASQYNYTK